MVMLASSDDALEAETLLTVIPAPKSTVVALLQLVPEPLITTSRVRARKALSGITALTLGVTFVPVVLSLQPMAAAPAIAQRMLHLVIVSIVAPFAKVPLRPPRTIQAAATGRQAES